MWDADELEEHANGEALSVCDKEAMYGRFEELEGFPHQERYLLRPAVRGEFHVRPRARPVPAGDEGAVRYDCNAEGLIVVKAGDLVGVRQLLFSDNEQYVTRGQADVDNNVLLCIWP